jgi:MOSC domain-containing protein YiiM
VEKVAATKGRVKAISISKTRGTQKVNVPQAELRASHGIVGDAHAGDWHRQLSLLDIESIDAIVAQGADVSAGDFAENITTEGINLSELKIGDKLRLGMEVEIEVTQFGKQCHGQCVIYEKIGDCIMPRRGVFASVSRGGSIKVGDIIEVKTDGD